MMNLANLSDLYHIYIELHEEGVTDDTYVILLRTAINEGWNFPTLLDRGFIQALNGYGIYILLKAVNMAVAQNIGHVIGSTDFHTWNNWIARTDRLLTFYDQATPLEHVRYESRRGGRVVVQYSKTVTELLTEMFYDAVRGVRFMKTYGVML